MKRLFLTSLGLVVGMGLAACGAGDDVAEGARGSCSAGGLLTDCPDAVQSAESACWRLVDCGAIAVRNGTNDDNNTRYIFDWDHCADSLEGMTAARERLVINCITASSCDQLHVDGSPENPNTDQMTCLLLGAY